METVYSSLVKKIFFKHFHATSFVTRKDENKKASFTNLKIKLKKNNYDSMVALSNFALDLKESKINSSMLKELLSNRKNEITNSISLRNKFIFQLVVLTITAMGIMWGWALKTEDELFMNSNDSMVTINVSNKSEEEKKQLENRINHSINSYKAEKIWVTTAINYIILFLGILSVFLLFKISLNKTDLIIYKVMEDALVYMKHS